MVTASRNKGLSALVHARSFEIISGISELEGGLDEGPNPHEILEAALAACTIITVQMYADRKQWPLKSTDVKVDIDSEGPKTHISLQISFQGDLSPEQHQRLLQIAGKCPIHRLLSNPIEIETKAL